MSAQSPSSTWLFHSSSSEISSDKTSFLDKVAKVNLETNFSAEGVKMTFTSAPALMKSLTNKLIL